MNLHQFQYLLAIHEYGTITKAAQELFVAAPSVSSAIKELEEELGYQLLIRHRNGVTFTEQGEEAIGIMQEIDSCIQRLKRLDHFDGTALTGHVVLGGSAHVNNALLSNLLLHLRQKYPGLKVTLTDGDSQTILKMTAQGAIDLGVIMFCNVDASIFLRELKRNQLQFTELFTDEMCFVVRQEHPLLQQDAANLCDILQYPYYTYGDALNEKTLDFFFSYNPQQEILQINDRDSLRRMLLHSDGITLMPLFSKDCIQEQFTGLSFLQIRDFAYECKVGWIHKGGTLNRAEQAVVAELKDEGLHLC